MLAPRACGCFELFIFLIKKNGGAKCPAVFLASCAPVFAYSVINRMSMSPLLQLTVSDISPPSLRSGRLLSPFLISQAMEKSSQDVKNKARFVAGDNKSDSGRKEIKKYGL